jgi:hypothetical protein
VLPSFVDIQTIDHRNVVIYIVYFWMSTSILLTVKKSTPKLPTVEMSSFVLYMSKSQHPKCIRQNVDIHFTDHQNVNFQFTNSQKGWHPNYRTSKYRHPKFPTVEMSTSKMYSSKCRHNKWTYPNLTKLITKGIIVYLLTPKMPTFQLFYRHFDCRKVGCRHWDVA